MSAFRDEEVISQTVVGVVILQIGGPIVHECIISDSEGGARAEDVECRILTHGRHCMKCRCLTMVATTKKFAAYNFHRVREFLSQPMRRKSLSGATSVPEKSAIVKPENSSIQ